MFSDFVDLFTDTTTGFIPQIVTAAVSILGAVLIFVGGVYLVRFAIRWVRSAR